MTQSLELDDKTRLLVVVPHPDDETLATGGLIQMALAAGARLRIIMATDGDNNPWPQRWIEKRWHIDASARERWGARRRDESATALARLGVAARDVRYFGWPDQGLTALLMDGSKGIDLLVAEILEFAPTLVVSPSLADLHPDHNALGTMLDIALSAGPFAECRRLEFLVHGNSSRLDEVRVPANESFARVKDHALQAHASQMALSKGRMTRLCKRSESFESKRLAATGDALAGELAWQWSRLPSRIHVRRHAVLLIACTGADVHRLELPLDQVIAGKDVEISKVNGTPLLARTRVSSDGIHLGLRGAGKLDRAYAKLERLGHRVLIYDRQGWEVRVCAADPPD